jgi:hypothetical protein
LSPADVDANWFQPVRRTMLERVTTAVPSVWLGNRTTRMTAEHAWATAFGRAVGSIGISRRAATDPSDASGEPEPPKQGVHLLAIIVLD